MQQSMGQENQSNTNRSSSMNSILSRVIRKAVSLPFENRKPMLEAFFVVYLPFAILVLLHYQIALPLVAKVEDGYENSSVNRNDLISLMVIELPFAITLCLLLLFSAAIAILASVSAHQGAPLPVKDTLLSLKWKRVLVSGLYIFLFLTVFVGIIVGFSFTPLTPLVGIVAALAYPYLASLTTLLLVISTVECECRGTRAFSRATEIIKKDKFNSYFLMLGLLLLSTPADVMFYVTSTDDDDVNGSVTQLGFLLVSTVLFCLTNFFTSIVYTLFYLDYKERNGEKIEELHSQYQLVPTAI